MPQLALRKARIKNIGRDTIKLQNFRERRGRFRLHSLETNQR